MPSSDPLSETKACELLASIFRRRGYDIARNIPFAEYGVAFHIDGWDHKARVGFEFLSSEDEDHDDLTLREYQALMDAQLRGELALFVIDEVEPLTIDDLRAAAEEFLDEVANAVKAQRVRRRPARKNAKKSAAKATPPPARKRAVAKKAAPKKRGSKKPVAKPAKPVAKPAAKKRTAKRAR
jgi:hypothetical protein